MARKVCIHGLMQYKWPEHWLASQQYCFSRCLGALWQWWDILHWWKGIQVEPISNVCHCSVLRKYVFMVWSSKMASMLTGVQGNAVFPVSRNLVAVVEHIAWMKRYLDGASQHYMPLQWAQKVHIHGWPSIVARTLFRRNRNTVFPGVEEPRASCDLW